MISPECEPVASLALLMIDLANMLEEHLNTGHATFAAWTAGNLQQVLKEGEAEGILLEDPKKAIEVLERVKALEKLGIVTELTDEMLDASREAKKAVQDLALDSLVTCECRRR